MKNSIPWSIFKQVTLGFILVISFISCNSNGKNTSEDELDLLEEYYEFQGFDLSNYDIPATIMLPDETANIGASTKPEIYHRMDDFYWDIKVGANFELHIEDYGDNKDLVANHKKKLKQINLFEIKYLIDEKDLILYEQKLIVKGEKNAPKTVGVEHKSYHVYGQRTVDDITYELRSRDAGHDEKYIQLMAKSIRSLQKKTNS